MVGVTFWLWSWIKAERSNRETNKILTIWCLFWLGTWSAYYWLIFESRADIHPTVKQFIETLFVYPNVYKEVLYRWMMSLPLTTTMLGTITVAGIILASKSKWNAEEGKTFLFLAGFIVATATMLALLPLPYSSIRYTFMLYPVVLLVASAAIVAHAHYYISDSRLCSLSILGVVIVYCVFSDDVNLAHARNIGTQKIIYRTEMTKWQQDVVYRRWDFEGPAIFVNQHISEGDLVLSTVQSVPFYLDKLDYFYRSKTSSEFDAIAACTGQRERWSNANLIHEDTTLQNLIGSGSSGIWLILRSPDQNEAHPVERDIGRVYGDYLRYKSQDDRLAVYYLPAKDS